MNFLQNQKWLEFPQNFQIVLTLFYTGGGSPNPPWQMISRDFSVDARNELKFHDFVSINICHVPLKPFFKKNFWKFEKRKFFFSTVPTSKGPPFEIFFFKTNFFHFFSNKSYFFNLNLHFTCSELSFDVYNMSFGENFKIFIFYYRIPINDQVLSATSHG